MAKHIIIMRLLHDLLYSFLLLIGISLITIEVDAIESPRMIINSDAPDIDSLLLESTVINAKISGIIADITIQQKYVYKGSNILDGALLMPGSPSITIHGCTVKIGNQTIKAEMKDREKVREMYDKAKKKFDPFFLTIDDPDAIQMHVSHIQPGSIIFTEIHYTEMIKPSFGLYTISLPKPVQSHYLKVLDYVPLHRDTYADTSFEPVKEYPLGSLHVNAIIAKGGNLSLLKADECSIQHTDQEAVCTYSIADAAQSKPITLTYRFADIEPQANLMMYEEGKDKYFLLSINPPSKAETRKESLGHEYIIVCDSASLQDNSANEFWKAFSKGLREQDKLNIIHFGPENTRLDEESQACTKDIISRAGVYLQRILSTEGLEPIQLIDVLQQIQVKPLQSDISSRSIIILTNGFMDANTDVYDAITKQLQDANVFTLAVGKEINERFFSAVHRLTMTDNFVLRGSQEELNKEAIRFADYIQKPSLTKLKVGFDGFDVNSLEPASYPDLFSDRPVLLFGKYKGKPKGRIVITGLHGNKEFVQTIDISLVKPLASTKGLQYLWAKQRASVLIDYNVYDRNNDRVKEITKLGMKYGFQTPYTSFGINGSDYNKSKNVIALMYQPLNLNGGTLVSNASGQQLARTSVVEVEAACNYADAAEHDEEGLISVESIMTEKVLDNTIIEKVRSTIEQQLSGMQECYAEALKKFRHLQGNVQLLFIFNDEGALTEISLADSELNIEEVEQCMIESAKRITLPTMIQGMAQISFLLEVL
jgi:Ca-activated chloride channel family protein